MPVEISDGAKSDLRELRRRDPRATAEIVAALLQVAADPDVIDKLTTWGMIDSGRFVLDNKRWLATRGRIWRLRILQSPAGRYRLFHAYHWPSRIVWVLAVVHRSDIDYDNLDSDHARRILDDWRRIEADDP